MKIQDEEWRDCPTCGRHQERIKETLFGCDTCKKPLDFTADRTNLRYHDFLKITIFYSNGSQANQLEFCSWKCVLKRLKSIKCDYFISLPNLNYEKDVLPGQGYKDFFKFINVKGK